MQEHQSWVLRAGFAHRAGLGARDIEMTKGLFRERQILSMPLEEQAQDIRCTYWKALRECQGWMQGEEEASWKK